MNDVIGDKSIVAFDIKECEESLSNALHINLWVDGKLITKVDNIAYVPSYLPFLSREIKKLKSESYENEKLYGLNDVEVFESLDFEGGEYHNVLSYDHSINSAIIYFYTEEGVGRMVYSFCDPRYEPKEDLGVVKGMDIDKIYLIEVLEELHKRLSEIIERVFGKRILL